MPRGTLISERGIRCCYHGWLFDVDGAILETPGEPATSTLKDRLCHGAYPTHEYNGIVFAYMGPPEEQPPFPMYGAGSTPSRAVRRSRAAWKFPSLTERRRGSGERRHRHGAYSAPEQPAAVGGDHAGG